MIYFIVGFIVGSIVGTFFMSWAFLELGKRKDWMMVNGKMQWIERTKRFREELEALKQSRLKEIKHG